MPPREWRLRIEDILAAVERVQRYTAGMDLASFLADEKTVDAVLFCYGVIGSALFLAFLFQVLRVAQLRQILMIVPAAAYGLSHQGLRVTLLWIFLALFLVMGQARAART